MRKTVAAMIAAALTLGSTTALAQRRGQFGVQGTAAFSVDRLMGFYATKFEEDLPAPIGDFEVDYTHFGFAWAGLNHGSPYTVPRFAFDFFVIDGLNVGGSIAYANLDIDVNNPGPGADDDLSTFLFAPRVGYVWMFSDVIGFWLRGGFTYHSSDDDNGFSEHAFALTVDPVFPIFPVDHFGFVVGPVIDFSITGERDYPGPRADDDIRYRSFGITAGMIGYL